jgi:2,4-dienoyl-CoA reductase (NADPH2)
VTLIDAANEIGGQFNVAKQVPGKEEFFETLRYFEKQIERTGVKLQLGRKVSAQDLVGGGYKHVVLATGVNPRTPDIEGIGHPKVLGYLEVLRDKKPVGKTVALIGAGGIGFDVAEFLLAEGASPSLDPAKFFAEWGVDATGPLVAGWPRLTSARFRARSICCSARSARSATAWARPPAGSIAPPSRTAGSK